jgi:hypothetical protein
LIEFRQFVEQTEKELLSLFHSIDRDKNGKLDKGELRAAFQKAGLAVPNSKLDKFFSEVDSNHDVGTLHAPSPPLAKYLLGIHNLRGMAVSSSLLVKIRFYMEKKFSCDVFDFHFIFFN